MIERIHRFIKFLKSYLLETLLIYSCQFGLVGFVKCLLRYGVNVNSVDFLGLTPLMWAAKTGHYQVVRLLLKEGANVQVEDRYHFTAVTWSLNRKAIYCTLTKALRNNNTKKYIQNLFRSQRNNYDKVVQSLLSSECPITRENIIDMHHVS